jgi:hypothetical protein
LPDLSAISRIVKNSLPFIFIDFIIGKKIINITFCNNLLNKCIAKIENILKIVAICNFIC